MSSNAEYWIKRFEELEKAQLLDEAKYVTELQELYERTLSDIKKEINNWLVRFAVNNQITLKEEKRIRKCKCKSSYFKIRSTRITNTATIRKFILQ